VGEEQNWNESLYAWWYDTASGIAGFHRIAHTPVAGSAQIWMGLVTADGVRYRRWSDDLPWTDDLRSSAGWLADGLRFEMASRTAKITYRSADCDVELLATDLHAPTGLHPARGDVKVSDVTGMLGKGHLEAAVQVTGRVRIGGRDQVVNGFGHRDHSWGPRALMDIRSTRWFHGTTGPELYFSAATGVTAGGGVHRAGYVIRDGEWQALRGVDIVMYTEIDGLSWRRADFVLTPTDGAPVMGTLDGVLDGMVFGAREFIGFESAGVLTVDGRTGVGNCQATNNPFGGRSMPAMASRAAVADGLQMGDHR
jgi:hypothetical protein